MSTILEFKAQKSAHLDIWTDVHTGYLDDVLEVFEKHQHPFIVLGKLAARWHGCGIFPGYAIDILVQDATFTQMRDDIVSSGGWSRYKSADKVHSDSSCTWLVRSNNKAGPWLAMYLRLWPESVYRLSVSGCTRYEVPDVSVTHPFVFEEEYCRDPSYRFGPRTYTSLSFLREIIPGISERCKFVSRAVPIFVPAIADHLHALIEQAFAENAQPYLDPAGLIEHYIKDHMWDWPPAGEWLLAEKISEDHRQYMKSRLDEHTRKPERRFNKDTKEWSMWSKPWDPTSPPAESDEERGGKDQAGDQLREWAAMVNRKSARQRTGLRTIYRFERGSGPDVGR